MAHIVPNAGDTTGGNKYEALDQSEPDSLDFEVAGLQTSGVIDGCAVSSNNSASNVAVTAGTVVLGGRPYSVSANSSLSLPSAPADNRFDLVVARISGSTATLTVLQGTNSSTNPAYPKSTSVLNTTATTNNFDPTTDVLLAAVYRSGSQSVTASRIVDKRRSVRTTIVDQGTTAPDASLGGSDRPGMLYYRTSGTDGAESGVYVKQSDGSFIGLAKDVGSHMPIGAMVAWPTDAALPAGCVEANGQSLSKTAYAALYSVYGDDHTETSTTFKVPNANDRFLRGTTTTSNVLSGSNTGGSNSVTLVTAQLPQHAHGLNSHTHTLSHTHGINHDHPSANTGYNGDHTHPSSDSSGNRGFLIIYYPSSSYFVTTEIALGSSGRYGTFTSAFPDQIYVSSNTGTNGNHRHTFNVPSFTGSTNSQSNSTTSGASGNTTNTGSGSSIDITPKYLYTRWIIRASLGNSSAITGSTDSVGRFSGDGAPDFTPDDIGSIYIDYTNDNAYISVNTDDADGWEQFDGTDYIEESATGATEDIDMDVPFQAKVMSEDCLFSVTNLAAATQIKTTYVYITGAFTPSWSAQFDWGDAGAPTYSDGTMIVLTSFNGETTVAAAFGGGGFSL